MCDPVTLTIAGAALVAGGTGANAYAGSQARKSAQKTMNRNTVAQGVSFDKRMELVNASDKRVMGYEQARNADANTLEDGTFSYLLGQAKEHADKNALEDKGLVTAQRQLNTEATQIKTLESARQSGFLEKVSSDVADAVASALPGSQTAMTARNFADRMSLMRTSLDSSGTGERGSFTADDLVRQAFSARQDAGREAVLREGEAGSYVEATQESATWADQLLAQGGARADQTNQRADLSRGMEQGELAVNSASDELAQQHNSFAKGLNDWLMQQRSGNYTDWASKAADDQGNYYGRTLDSENQYTEGMIGANTKADDTRTALANYKIQNTTANTTVGDIMKVAGQAAMAYGSATAASAPTAPKFSALLKPNNSAVLAGRAARAGNPVAPQFGYG